VIETAGKGKQTFEGILALRQEMDQLAFTYGKRAENVQLLLRHLYRRPAITAIQASEQLEVSHQTASSLLNKMTQDGMLQEITGYQRNRVFVFTRYLTLFGA
jgi:Fic family protein